MFTILPGFFASMRRRATSHDSSHGALRLVSRTRSTSSRGMRVAYWASGMPAWLDQDVDQTEFVFRALDHRGDGVGVGDVQLDGEGSARRLPRSP